jgi:curved DNA-binding protein CbpA
MDQKGTESMRNQAFQVLGIAPTDDGRAIRAAFLRLARIYHPDRFVGQPEDVREEAERRMKEATVAYESLRAANKGAAPKPEDEIDEREIHKRAAQYREIAERRREKEAGDRERWRRWERVEAIARRKAKLEADIAERVASEVDGSPVDAPESRPVDPAPIKPPPRATRDQLNERLDAARRGVTSPIARRA